jgi:hypothetical protein
MRLVLAICGATALAFAQPSLAADCAPPSGSVRVMLHDASVIGARLKVYAQAAGSPRDRATAMRTLFEAAACPQISERGAGKKDLSIECTAPGAGTDTIVVGIGQKYDGAGSPPLLASLQEALAAAPRRHTFRWVAFSTHETKEERTKLVQKPKGAMRLVGALSEVERQLVRSMVHIGPIGFGAVRTHPPGADDRLGCAFESAAKIAGVEIGKADNLVRECNPAPGRLDCEEAAKWSGGNDWVPFRRAGIPVFGIHSGDEVRVGARLRGDRYYASYRMLAVFLALADEALAPGATAEPAAR